MSFGFEERAEKDREDLYIRELDLVLEEPEDYKEDHPVMKIAKEETMDIKEINGLVKDDTKIRFGSNVKDKLKHLSEEELRYKITWKFWKQWITILIGNKKEHTPLFNTKQKTVKGIDINVVQEDTYGQFERPVLQRSKEFSKDMKQVGLMLIIQYILDSSQTPQEVCDEVPFDFFPYDVIRMREFAQQYEFIWGKKPGQSKHYRTPISLENPLQGMLYIMYVQKNNSIIPKYIGISDLHKIDEEGLNWNMANITKDSVFGRWGYGSSQHMGELSRAMFPKEYDSSPKPKYQNWKNDLFFQDTKALSNQVYIAIIPILSDSIYEAEESLVKISKFIFGDEVLNVEFAQNITQSEVSKFSDT